MMKKIFCLAFILVSAYSFTQNEIYVYRQGGGKKIFTGFKLGYNSFVFNPAKNCSGRDTLICEGNGFEKCKIDKWMIKAMPQYKPSYEAYNYAIKYTSKLIRKSKLKEGKTDLKYKGFKMEVSFKNAQKNGEGEYLIRFV